MFCVTPAAPACRPGERPHDGPVSARRTHTAPVRPGAGDAADCPAAVAEGGQSPSIPPVARAGQSPLRLWYSNAANTWVEALPIGNGSLGAMVFGGVGRERLQLNDDTLWSGGPRDWDNAKARDVLPEIRKAIFAGQYVEADALAKKMMGPYTESYQPLGDLSADLRARRHRPLVPSRAGLEDRHRARQLQGGRHHVHA